MDKICFQNVISEAPVHLAVTLIDHKYKRIMHYHDFAELFLVESGHGRHILPTGEHKLSEGDLVYVAPGHRHCLEAVSMRIMNIASSISQMI